MKIRDRIKELRRVKAANLVPNPRNWRTHPQAQQDALRGLLSEVGYADALLCREDADGRLVLIDGHLRAETTPDQRVPVLVLDVTEEEADKLLLTLDPLAAMAEASQQRLGELLAATSTKSEAVQALLDELAAKNGIDLFEAGSDEARDAEPQIDRAAELQEQWGTESGQLWAIPGKAGEHRLLCGDSTKAEDVARVMGGAKAGICFTSPPYEQQREYTEESKTKAADWDGLMSGVFGNLPMSDDGQVLVNLGLIHRDGEWVPYWDGWIEWMRSQCWRRFGWYVWDQGSGLPGDWNGRLAPSHEFVFHFNRMPVRPRKTVPKNPNSGPMGSNLRNAGGKNAAPSSVCNDPNKIPDSVFRVNRNSAHGTGHPATFPVALAVAAIRPWRGIIFDPFLGSGTTMLAAEQLSRICYGIEISPAYCAVILQRMTDAGMEPYRRDT